MEWYVCTWYQNPEGQTQKKEHILAIKAKSLPDAYAAFSGVAGVSKKAVLEEVVKATDEDIRAIEEHLCVHQQRTGTDTRQFWFYKIT